MTATGAVMFARFAAPPNRLGYCGPDDHDHLVAYGNCLLPPDRGLGELARAFEGAWPWLELLAGAARADPLDDDVVEAYWIGNHLVHSVDAASLGNHLVDRFASRAGRHAGHVTAGVGTRACANHAFHVFGVYPWVGLLREEKGADIAVSVLDSCRISWGRIRSVADGTAVADVPPLRWNGVSLSLGAPTARPVVVPAGLAVGAGDVVALHWDAVCARLDTRRLAWLRAMTIDQLALTNTTGIAAAL